MRKLTLAALRMKNIVPPTSDPEFMKQMNHDTK